MIPALIISEDGKGIKDTEFKFDTRFRHMPIDLEAVPRHYEVAEMAGGTALSVVDNTVTTKQETLLSIDHKLGYTPFAFAYFYVISKNGNAVSIPAGRYGQNVYSFSGEAGGGTTEDALTFKVDGTSFKIIHYLASQGFGPGTTITSIANQYLFRIKYYIASMDTGMTSYTGDRNTFI